MHDKAVDRSLAEQTAPRYAELKLQLKKQGTPIPLNDVWIAALVLQRQATLFTRDSDFEASPGVSGVRWAHAERSLPGVQPV